MEAKSTPVPYGTICKAKIITGHRIWVPIASTDGIDAKSWIKDNNFTYTYCSSSAKGSFVYFCDEDAKYQADALLNKLSLNTYPQLVRIIVTNKSTIIGEAENIEKLPDELIYTFPIVNNKIYKNKVTNSWRACGLVAVPMAIRALHEQIDDTLPEINLGIVGNYAYLKKKSDDDGSNFQPNWDETFNTLELDRINIFKQIGWVPTENEQTPDKNKYDGIVQTYLDFALHKTVTDVYVEVVKLYIGSNNSDTVDQIGCISKIFPDKESAVSFYENRKKKPSESKESQKVYSDHVENVLKSISEKFSISRNDILEFIKSNSIINLTTELGINIQDASKLKTEVV